MRKLTLVMLSVAALGVLILWGTSYWLVLGADNDLLTSESNRLAGRSISIVSGNGGMYFEGHRVTRYVPTVAEATQLVNDNGQIHPHGWVFFRNAKVNKMRDFGFQFHWISKHTSIIQHRGVILSFPYWFLFVCLATPAFVWAFRHSRSKSSGGAFPIVPSGNASTDGTGEIKP